MILPIWHNIDAKDILKNSLYLADKYALTTAMGLDELVYRIVEEIRPDIVNSQAIMHACRDAQGRGKIVEIHYKNIHPSEIHMKIYQII